MTERLHFHFSLSCIGERNGNPLQCFHLENPRDRGAWWAAVCGVTWNWTWLKWLSSSSSICWERFKANFKWIYKSCLPLVFSIIITGVDCHRFRVEFEVNAPLKIQKRYNLILYFYVLYSFLSLIKYLNSLPQST